MIDIKDRICDVVADKVMSAEAAAEFVKDGDNLGVSGFTPSGYPKAVPLALAEKGKKTPFKVNVWTGASVGPEIDQAMVEAGIIDRRLPYQTNGTMRKAINAGKVKYADIHLSHMAQMVRYGYMAGRPTGPDVAIVEVCKINDLGDGKVGLIPTTSMGNSSSYVAGAKKVIVEVNTTQPVGLEGMHDSYIPLDPPNRQPIPITAPEDRIGTTYIPCEVEKIVAVVPCDRPDIVRPLGEIVVMAPDAPRSGSGCALTVTQPVHYQLLKKDVGLTVYKCSGTPADCIKLARNQILDREPDLVVGGINHGDNSATNVHYSGTMGVVIEGCLNGIPSIGFSICDHAPGADFDAAGPYVRKIAAMVLEKGLPPLTCLNVNFPNTPELKGVKICEQAKGHWSGEWQACPRRDDTNYYWLTGEFIDHEPENEKNDHWALANGYVAITPTVVDMTAYHFMDELKSWEL